MKFVQEKRRTEMKRGRRMKNKWEKKREMILILKLVEQVTKFAFGTKWSN